MIKCVVVMGLGSMGKRRIRLIHKFDPTIIIVGIDTNEKRRIEVQSSLSIITCASLEDSLTYAPECAFICTSPLSHALLINKCLSFSLHVFTELNLVDDLYDENTRLAEEKEKVLFLSSTFLYREEILYVKDAVKKSLFPKNYIYHVGQYLPDWHPWEHYGDYFVGQKRTNGCREIMAIELPWLIKSFGNIKELVVRKSKKTSLEIDFPDNYFILLKHENNTQGFLSVDIISRKAVRKLEVFSEDLYLTWNGTPDSLFNYDIPSKNMKNISLYDAVDTLEGYSTFIIENAYYNEIEDFFNVIAGETIPKYSFVEDKYVLSLIDEIEA